MAPSNPPIAVQLRQLIYYHLDNNLLKNALFLSQRLVAYESRNPEAAYLLAYCQYQSGFVKASWETSRHYALKGLHLGCAYVFAQSCLELGRYVDGLHALDKSRSLWNSRNTWNQHSETRRQHLPDAAAVWCLKGKLLKANKNLDEAVQCWVSALKLNPFMWDAFLGLNDSGAKVHVPNIYKLSSDMMNMVYNANTAKENAPMQLERSNSSIQNHAQTTNQQVPADPFVSTHKSISHMNGPVLFEKLNNSKMSVNTANTILDEEAMNTPSTVVDLEDSILQSSTANWEAGAGPIRKARSVNEGNVDPQTRYKTAPPRAKSRIKSASEEGALQHDSILPPGPPTKRTISGQIASSSLPQPNGLEQRRSARLQTTRPPGGNTVSKMSSIANSLGLREGREIKKAKAPMVKSRTATASTVGRVVSGNRTKPMHPEVMDAESKDSRTENFPVPNPPIPSHKTQTESQVDKDIDALKTILDLICRLASAQLSLSRYDCETAIKIYNDLPSSQRETPYVLAQIGKSYYEQAKYADAEKYFIRVRQLSPSRLEDMELYSTTLWHLKSEIELAYLAHELIEVERLSPQAWVAIGNSFSLQREHEQALKCFRRATQLDPHFAYGFTLQGHEYIANEEFEKALDAYRSALLADDRHYNAWYGLGKVYEKMGKWEVAERHYRTARGINPSNAVLTCCIGLVLEKLKKPEKALDFYTRACKLAPNSALSRFKKAKCLMSLDRPYEALEELNILQEVAPNEANVWFLLGRLYKMTRQRSKAITAFTNALNCDPKASQYIKDAMETLDDEDEMVGDEDEPMD